MVTDNYFKMCSKDERDKRIREMMEKKNKAKIDTMNSIVEKIVSTKNDDAKLVNNSYGITDPNICPQIAEGEFYIKNLSEDIKSVVINYTGCGSVSINKSLRKKNKEKIGEIMKLDKAFLNAPPLTHPMTVYRGIRGIEELRDDNGFSSCSLHKIVSVCFGGGKVFEILLPIGTRVLFVKPISLFPGEDEVLVDRTGEFRALLDPCKLVYMSHL